jgi:hypothetical protein
MTTFSQFVDEMVGETKRFDLATEIAAYINQTVREVHFRSDTGSVLYFRENLQELLITANSDDSFGWDIPNPAIFQGIIGVQYADQFNADNGCPGVWAEEVTPGRNMAHKKYSFYRIGTGYAFTGYGHTGSRIKLAYYQYPSRLKYYTVANRPASWDDAAGWTYKAEYDVSDQTRANARALVTNWLLLRWHDVLSEGVRAKIYKRVSDEVRGRTAYSLYSTLRQGLWTSEIADLGGLA